MSLCQRQRNHLSMMKKENVKYRDKGRGKMSTLHTGKAGASLLLAKRWWLWNVNGMWSLLSLDTMVCRAMHDHHNDHHIVLAIFEWLMTMMIAMNREWFRLNSYQHIRSITNTTKLKRIGALLKGKKVETWEPSYLSLPSLLNKVNLCVCAKCRFIVHL